MINYNTTQPIHSRNLRSNTNTYSIFTNPYLTNDDQQKYSDFCNQNHTRSKSKYEQQFIKSMTNKKSSRSRKKFTTKLESELKDLLADIDLNKSFSKSEIFQTVNYPRSRASLSPS